MIIGIILGIIGNGCKYRWILFIRSLQLILNQPLICVSFPSINIDLFRILKQIAAYDILDSYNIWGTPFFAFLKFNNFEVPFVNK